VPGTSAPGLRIFIIAALIAALILRCPAVADANEVPAGVVSGAVAGVREPLPVGLGSSEAVARQRQAAVGVGVVGVTADAPAAGREARGVARARLAVR
jgi:hypothetical protein